MMKRLYLTENARKSIRFIVIAIIVIIVLEISVFNLRHWTTRFTSPKTNALDYEVTLSEGIERSSDGSLWPIRQGWESVLSGTGEAESGVDATQPDIEVTVSRIGQTIRTIYILPDFGDFGIKRIDVSISYHDENIHRTLSAQILNGYEPSFYIPFGALGKVDELTITYDNKFVGIREIKFNEPLPWTFQWLRVLILTLIVTVAWFWKKHKFSSIVFDPLLKWQRRLDKGVVSAFIVLLFLVMFFTIDFGLFTGNELRLYTPFRKRITHTMAEALVLGQLHLDIEPHESLLNAEQPYNWEYRDVNEVIFPWDHAYYNGQFFSYFGIVPVLLLYLPFYLIFGVHISTQAATFIFSAISAIGLYLLWKEIVNKYLKSIPYCLYLAGVASILFGSGLLLLVARPRQYESAIASGLMFSVWGLYFVLCASRHDSFDRIRTFFLVLCGICMSLAVGCRPTMLFVSLLVPVLMLPALRTCLPLGLTLKNKQARKAIFKNAAALLTPYILIGAGLAWYNYARFGSIFEFGINYQLTIGTVAVLNDAGILGVLRRAYDGVNSFLFNGFAMAHRFPFVFATTPESVFTGFDFRDETVGAFALPITWFLPPIYYMRKKDAMKKALPIIVSMAVTSLILIALILPGAVAKRYVVDFFWLILLISLICMGLLFNEKQKHNDSAAAGVRRLAIVASVLTCFVSFGWGVVGEYDLILLYNPIVFRYLSDLFFIL